MDKQTKVDLSEFMSRPTLIKTVSWGSGGPSPTSLYPWYEYLDTTTISNKLQNFGMFRGNLHLKFIVSSNPFVYGSALISYTPMYSDVTDSIDETTNIIQNSQKPCFWVYPHTNSGGEMVLPFFWPHQYVDLSLATTVQKLGKLQIDEVVALDTANDATVPTLSIQIYAWMEDLMLEGPTSISILQVGVEDRYPEDGSVRYDTPRGPTEYTQGPVERVSTNVASVAGKLSNIPIIGSFAKATEIGASAVSSVASLFGWSKVIPVENHNAIKIMSHADWNSSEKTEPGSKFALDPKAELSVDPRILNLDGRDELTLSYLLQKETFLLSESWVVGDAQDSTIMRMPVWPMVYDSTLSSGVYTLNMPPMAYFGSMFEYWRGDIIFRFKLVASSFHRGRLKITFEPHGNVASGDYSNVLLTKIVDITESNDIEFRVPYMQEEAWSQLIFDPEDDKNIGHNDGSGAHVFPYTNGTISVKVLTPLSSPQAVPTCTLIAFVRGGDNLEYSVPHEPPHYTTHQDLQVGRELGDTNQVVPQRFSMQFGERVSTLRQVLSRTSISQIYIPYTDQSAISQYGYRIYFRRTPNPPGFNTGEYSYAESVITPETNARFTWSFMHPINWVAPCFAAMRGGIQNTISVEGISSAPATIRIVRRNGFINTNATELCGYTKNYGVNTASLDDYRADIIQDHQAQNSPSGMIAFNTNSTPSCLFEATDQHAAVFNTTRQEQWLRGTSVDDTYNEHYEVLTTATPSDFEYTHVVRACNIAPDFNLHFFVCTPTVYYCTDLYTEKYEA